MTKISSLVVQKEHLPAVLEKRPSKKNALNRYVTVLPQNELRSHRNKERLWKVAAVATAVAFIAIAAVSNALVLAFAPQYELPFAILTLSLMPIGLKTVKLMFERAKFFQNLTKIDAGVVKEFKQLSKKSNSDLSRLLRKMHLDPKRIKRSNHLKDLKTLTPILAHHLYWKKQPGILDNKIKKSVRFAKKIKDNPSLVATERQKALVLKYQEKPLAKVHSAFFYGLLKKPKFQGSLGDICSIEDHSFEERKVAKEFSSKEADAFIRFNKKKYGALGYSETNHMSTARLARRLFEAVA